MLKNVLILTTAAALMTFPASAVAHSRAEGDIQEWLDQSKDGKHPANCVLWATPVQLRLYCQ